MGKKLPTISSALRRGLLRGALAGFLVMTLFSLILQCRMAVKESDRLLRITLQDVYSDLRKASDDYLLEAAHHFADALESDQDIDLAQLCEIIHVNEVNIIGTDGVIERSSHAPFVGYDMRSGEQSAAFLPLLEGVNELVMPIEPISYDTNVYRKYAAVALAGGGFVQVGITPETLQLCIADQVRDITTNRHIMETGMVFVLDANNRIVSRCADLPGTLLKQLLDNREDVWKTYPRAYKHYWVNHGGITGFWMYAMAGEYRILAIQPLADILEIVRPSLLMAVLMGVALFVFLYFGTDLLVRRVVVRRVDRVAETLSEIALGNLDAKVTERSTQEFAAISDGINATVDALKGHIAREAALIDEELGYARSIQRSALPALTQPFTDGRAFSLFACMDTAREVGGDFYDFYMLDARTLAFLIADVSGKGIPAAMFMMTGKTTLRDSAERASDIGDAFAEANRRLCAGNDAGVFITAWMGLMDLETGEVRFANAGHNPPVLIRNGRAEYLNMDADLILGLMDDEAYASQALALQRGDLLFLYTDGVTEATNASRELYGEARLLEVLDGLTPEGDKTCEAVCDRVTRSLEAFVDGAPQADDITMLCLCYRGG